MLSTVVTISMDHSTDLLPCVEVILDEWSPRQNTLDSLKLPVIDSKEAQSRKNSADDRTLCVTMTPPPRVDLLVKPNYTETEKGCPVPV